MILLIDLWNSRYKINQLLRNVNNSVFISFCFFKDVSQVVCIIWTLSKSQIFETVCILWWKSKMKSCITLLIITLMVMTIVSSPLQKKIQSNFELIFENTDGKWSLRIIQKNVVAVPEWPGVHLAINMTRTENVDGFWKIVKSCFKRNYR